MAVIVSSPSVWEFPSDLMFCCVSFVLTSTALQCGHLIRTSPLRSSFPSSSLSSSSSTTGLCMTLLQGPLLSSAEGTDSLFSISRLSHSCQDDDKVLRIPVCWVSVLKSLLQMKIWKSIFYLVTGSIKNSNCTLKLDAYRCLARQFLHPILV